MSAYRPQWDIETNNRKIDEKSPKTWRFNNMLPDKM